MSHNSISSDTHTKNFANDKSDEYSLKPLEVDSGDWELRMAKLVGLELESLYADTEAPEESANSQLSPSQLIEKKTEQSLSSNPFAKLGFVGTATLAIVLFVGGFLTQLMSSYNQKPKNNSIVPLEIPSPTKQKSRESDLDAKIETLETKLALTEQAEAVKLAQQQLRNAKLMSPSKLEVQHNSQLYTSQVRRVVAQKIRAPMSTVYPERIVTVERIVRVPYVQKTPFSQSPTVAQPIFRKPVNQPLVNVIPSPPLKPLQERRSADLDNSEQEVVTDRPRINITTPVNQRNDQVQQRAINPQAEEMPTSQTTVVNQVVQQSPKPVAVGSHTKAVLATALFGETTKFTDNDKNSDHKNVFVVRLKEPLKAVDGAIAVPANTELLTEIRSLSEQGLLQLDVVKMMMENNGKFIEKKLPQNAIMVHAPQGKPLIANQFPNRGSSILGMDIGLFVLGGLGKAAELFNRTESQVVTTNAGGTIVSNTNPQANILAGALEGGMNTVVPQISQRNQQAISQMNQRTNIWFLPAGTTVEIYVNQAMQF